MNEVKCHLCKKDLSAWHPNNYYEQHTLINDETTQEYTNKCIVLCPHCEEKYLFHNCSADIPVVNCDNVKAFDDRPYSNNPEYLGQRLNELAEENTALIWWITRRDANKLLVEPYIGGAQVVNLNNGRILSQGKDFKEAIVKTHRLYIEKGIY